MITHTVKRGADVFVCNNVPAEVCDLCGDTLLAPGTIRRLEDLMAGGRPADGFAPPYEYA